MIHRFVATVGAGPKAAERKVTVEPLEGGRFEVTIDGRTRVVDAARVEPRTLSLLDDGGGRARMVDVEGAAPDLTVYLGGAPVAIKLVDARKAAAAVVSAPRESGPQPIRAPMPGKVVKILVAVGDPVKAGQGVVVVEAMKMENELRAVRDGKVLELSVKEGQAVDAGSPLALIG